jgi:hypothetical protein
VKVRSAGGRDPVAVVVVKVFRTFFQALIRPVGFDRLGRRSVATR